MAYRRDNNELLLFVLKQLAKEQVTFYRSRYRSEPDVIEIQEDEFTDRVSECTFKKRFKIYTDYITKDTSTEIERQSKNAMFLPCVTKKNRYNLFPVVGRKSHQ